MNPIPLFLSALIAFVAAILPAWGVAQPLETAAAGRAPIVIAHRGASGYLPEHTLAAYALAVFQGADFIEPDLVMTKDGHLIARHENALDDTTDVAEHAQFASRRTTKVLDGSTITAWWSEDFTLAEIRQLRARERIPALRPGNARLNDQLQIPTLQEIIDLAAALEKLTGRPIGIYPETKHPTYFASIGLAMEAPLLAILRRKGFEDRRDRVFVQSFEVSNLKALAQKTKIPLVQLLGNPNSRPYDVAAAGGSLTYGQMATAQGLAEIARYARGVGPAKGYVIPVVDGVLSAANTRSFVRDAQAAGLLVHPYTFRAENQFLPANLRNGADPAARGDLKAELGMFVDAGIDGFFTDHPGIGAALRAARTRGK
jgi:glycerophosphoryl diester phosphodiesterase